MAVAAETNPITSHQIEEIIHDSIEPRESWFHRWFPYLKWSPSSPDKLRQAEEDLLTCKFCQMKIYLLFVAILVFQLCTTFVL